MRLLQLEEVTKHHWQGSHRFDTLVRVSLELYAGELVAIWGPRHSGRSTLLRLAAGIEAPDSGIVRVAGRTLQARHAGTMPAGIAYCRGALQIAPTSTVLEDLISPQLARGIESRLARAHALATLERAEIRRCAYRSPSELTIAETARVAIAKALCLEPALLLIDEPTTGVELVERDEIFHLLRSLAHDDGLAVLACVGDSAGLFSVDRALTLSAGELHGAHTPEIAPVLDLRTAQRA